MSAARLPRRWCAAAARGGLILLLLASLGPPAAALAPSRPRFDLRPEAAVLRRLLHGQAAGIELGTMAAPAGEERYRIFAHHGRVKVEGSTPSALLFGVGWYLKYIAHEQISTDGERLNAGPLPLPSATVTGATRYRWRYALNENTDGYTSPYWGWRRWQHEIDVLALVPSHHNHALGERIGIRLDVDHVVAFQPEG